MLQFVGPTAGLSTCSCICFSDSQIHPSYLKVPNVYVFKIFRDMFDQADQDEMPHTINVTAEEQEAIRRVCCFVLFNLYTHCYVMAF